MPEALLEIPPLQISNGTSSEAETGTSSSVATTDRSSTSQTSEKSIAVYDPKTRRLSNVGQAKIKGRKSTGKRNQKKLSLNVNSQQKNTAAAFKLKSRIPRPLLLSPSSSSTSLTSYRASDTSFRSTDLRLADGSITTKEHTITTVLQRQKTGVILAYRQRKSISQMDIKQYRRNAQMSQPLNCDVKQNQIAFAHDDASFVHKMCNFNEMGYAFGAQDPRMAGMKIFAIIMLNAWRKRRNEVKRMTEDIAELKKGTIKSRNQLHVLNSLFRVEQKRNDELNSQLKRTLEDINTIKSTCESLTTSIISLKADNALLEQQLHTKDQETESLNTLLSQTKSELFKTMNVQRELQANVSMGQRKVQTLENQKNDLINEMYELEIEARQTQDLLQAEIQVKSDELKATQAELKNLEEKLNHLNDCKQKESMESLDKQQLMRKDIEKLEDEVKILRKTLDLTLGRRLKRFCYNSLTYSGTTVEMLHWFAFFLLPATPPPKTKTFPLSLSLDKVMSIVKR